MREKGLTRMIPVGKTPAGPITLLHPLTARLILLPGKGAAVRRDSLAEAEGAGVVVLQREGGRVQRD